MMEKKSLKLVVIASLRKKRLKWLASVQKKLGREDFFLEDFFPSSCALTGPVSVLMEVKLTYKLQNIAKVNSPESIAWLLTKGS